jgi:hypothetical protein
VFTLPSCRKRCCYHMSEVQRINNAKFELQWQDMSNMGQHLALPSIVLLHYSWRKLSSRRHSHGSQPTQRKCATDLVVCLNSSVKQHRVQSRVFFVLPGPPLHLNVRTASARTLGSSRWVHRERRTERQKHGRKLPQLVVESSNLTATSASPALTI